MADWFSRLGQISCTQVSDDLTAYLHDGLSPRQQAAVERHLQGCADCRTALEAARRLEADLRLEAAGHQPKISRQVSARIQRNLYQHIRKGLIVRRIYQFAGTVAVAVAILLLFLAGDRLLRQSVGSPRPAAHLPTAIIPTLLPSATPTPAAASQDILVVGAGWYTDQWKRNFNPFSANGHSFPCLYEPLMLQQDQTGALTPWLATEYAWNDDNTLLTIRLRQGVRWSDGAAFDSNDVLATFALLRQHPDITGIPDYPHPLAAWLDQTGAKMSAPDGFTVRFTFQQADPAILYDLMTVPMLPQHVWAHLEKPGEFTNPNPVGTGPFTQVTLFETRQNGTERTVQFERNPYYWQADQIAIQGVRYTIRHEEHAIVDLQQNRLDWALLDLPDPQKDFVDLSPQFFHIAAAWGSTNFLELNTSRPPFDIPTVRKAISMAIDREKLLANFSPQALPANAIGLTTRERYWWNQQAIADGYWLEYNLDMANAMLDEIGFYRGPDGTRVSPSGVPLRFEYLLNDDAFDWNGIPTDAIMRLIADDLAAVGIEVVLSEVADDRYWDEMSKGKFDMVIVESGGLWLYHSTLLPDDYGLCCGSKTNAEAGRYFSAAAPALFQAFDAETDPARQRDIIGQLQTIFVEDAPVLPLYASQHYYQYNTSRFTGFPTETNPYASGSPMAMDALLVFLHLKPAR